MNKNSYTIYLLFLVLLIVSACDQTQDDVLPSAHYHASCQDDHLRVESFELHHLDILSNDNLLGDFNMHWIGEPRHGRRIVDAASMTFHYQALVRKGMDTLSYVICGEINCDTALVIVEIDIDSSLVPVPTCRLSASNDTITFTDWERKTGQVLSNDSLCGFDRSEIKISYLGASRLERLEIEDGIGEVSYYTRKLKAPKLDSVAYVLEAGEERDTAFIYFNFEPNCEEFHTAFTDTIYFGFDEEVVFIPKVQLLDNDKLCLNNLPGNPLELKQYLGNGYLEKLGFFSGFAYYPEPRNIGTLYTDTFEYEIENLDGERTSAFVYLISRTEVSAQDPPGPLCID